MTIMILIIQYEQNRMIMNQQYDVDVLCMLSFMKKEMESKQVRKKVEKNSK